MYCKKCGNEISENLKVCSHCGTPTGEALEKNGTHRKKNRCALAALVLELLQTILFFVPVFEVSIPRYGSFEKVTIRQILYDTDWGGMDVTLAVNAVTAIVVGLSVLAVIFTLMAVFGNRKGNGIGHVFRFLSCIYIPLVFVYASGSLNEICQVIVRDQGVTVEIETLVFGTLHYAIAGLLLLVLILMVFTTGKGRKETQGKNAGKGIQEGSKEPGTDDGQKIRGEDTRGEDTRIPELENEIRKLYEKLGDQYYALHKENPEEELREPVEAVRQLQGQIGEIRRQIQEKRAAEAEARAKAEAKKKAEAQAMESERENSYGFCPHCGTALTKDAVYCAKCGKKVN